MKIQFVINTVKFQSLAINYNKVKAKYKAQELKQVMRKLIFKKIKWHKRLTKKNLKMIEWYWNYFKIDINKILVIRKVVKNSFKYKTKWKIIKAKINIINNLE